MIPGGILVAIALAAQAPQVSYVEPLPEASTPTCVSSNTGPVFSPSGWQVIPDATVPAGIVAPAMSAWNSASCNPGGTAFPLFTTGPIPGSKTVTITFVNDYNHEKTNSCGDTSPSGGITLYSTARRADGSTASCGTTAIRIQNLEHEFGHKLTLADSPCAGYIMSPVNFTEPLTPTSQPLPRAIQEAECSQAAKSNITPAEQPPPPPPPPPPTTCDCPNGCNSSGVCLPVNCSADPSAPQCQQCDENPTVPGCGDGGGGLDPCDPDDPCDDVITRPNASPPPPPPAWRRHHAFVMASTLTAERSSANS